jgi:hypothetical protein
MFQIVQVNLRSSQTSCVTLITDDCQVIANAKQQEKAHFEHNITPKRSIWLNFPEQSMHLKGS